MASKTYAIELLVENSQAIAAAAAAAAAMAAYRQASTTAAQAATRSFDTFARAVLSANAAVLAGGPSVAALAGAYRSAAVSAAAAGAATAGAATATRDQASATRAVASASAAAVSAGQHLIASLAAQTQAYQANATAAQASAAAAAQAGAAGGAGGGGAGGAGGAGGRGGAGGGWAAGLGRAAMTAATGGAYLAVDAAERISDAKFGASQDVGGMEAAVRDIASMSGKTGQTLAVVKDIITLRNQTLQTAHEATAMQRTLLGSGQASVAMGKISDADLKAVAVEAGKIQASKGIDPAAMGELVAQVINASPGKTDASAVSGDVLRMIGMFEATRGNVPALVNQYISASHNISEEGGMFSPKGATATFMTLAASNPRNPGRALGYVGRALYSDKPELVAHRNAIGVNEDMGLEQRLALEMQSIADTEAAARKGGKTFNLMSHLTKTGFGNLQDRDTLAKLYQARQRGLERYFADMATAEPPTEKARVDFQLYAASAPGMQAKEEVAKDAATVAQGGGTTAQFYGQRGQAYQDIRANKWYGDLLPKDYADFSPNPLRNLMGLNFGAVIPSLLAAGDLNATHEDVLNRKLAGSGQPAQFPLQRMMAGGNPIQDVAAVNAKILAGGGTLNFNSPDLAARIDRVVAGLERVTRAITDPAARARQIPPILRGERDPEVAAW